VRILFVAICLLAASSACLASQASKLFKEGQKAEHARQIAKAYLLYAQAAALEPENQFYWLKSQALQIRAALEAKAMPQLRPGAAIPAPDPGAAEASIPEPSPQELDEARKPLPPVELTANPGRHDFDLQADSKSLFEQVSKAFGLDCVFDSDYQPSRPIRFRMHEADYREALHGLEAATGSFIVPVTPHLFLVAKDTPQKRAEVEPSVAVTIDLPEPTSTQDLTSLITAVQQTMSIQKVSWDTQKNVVVMRDTISKVLPARALFEDLLYPRAQVAIEIEFLEASRNELTSYGLSLPNSLPIVPLGNLLRNVVTIPTGLSGLLTFGGGQTLMGIGIVNPSLVARMSKSSGRLLMRAEMRSVDGQPATFHVGDRYPIVTSRYGLPDSSNTGNYPPSFTFEDLGLKIKATPKVHGMEEVTLDLETEFRMLTGEVVGDNPVISNRQLKSVVRLRTGQWAVVAGLMDANEARTIAGIAGVSNLPTLGPLFSKRTKKKDSTEVLVLMRPELVTLPPDQVITHTFRLGSETRPLTPL
jgi:hypothetical protein